MSTDDASLLALLIQQSQSRDISGVLQGALAYNAVRWGNPAVSGASAPKARQQQANQAAKPRPRRSRSRSRGKSREPARSVIPNPPQVTLSSLIPQVGVPEEKSSEPLPRRERRARSPAPSAASTEGSGGPPNRGERATLITRLRDERQQFKAAMRRFFDSQENPEVLLIAWAKAANLRSKLANNYRVRQERGWTTANAKTLESDLSDAGGDPGEPEYLSALLHWPSYSEFFNERTRQRIEVALVMQSDDGRSLWEHPEALPARVVALATILPTYDGPPKLGAKGIAFLPPSREVWDSLKARARLLLDLAPEAPGRGSFSSEYSYIQSDDQM